MKIRIRDFAVLICLIIAVNIPVRAVNDTIIIRSDTDTEMITANLDSLVNNWYVKLALGNNPGLFSDDTTGVMFSDSIYKEDLVRSIP